MLGLDGEVLLSYPTSWANTLRAQWGMNPTNTSDFPFGAEQVSKHAMSIIACSHGTLLSVFLSYYADVRDGLLWKHSAVG